MRSQPIRHILSLSGGKDSTALAIYLRDQVPEMEYVFMDTGEELPETYDYLEKIEAFLGKPIVRLKSKRYGFEDLLKMRRGLLPSPQLRWCTEYLKIKPFEEYVGDDSVISYIAIRADEPHRKGYISTKTNITPRYPFIEDGLAKEDILQLLVEQSGLGLPDYYRWRSRSGCYFCFFQQQIEWVGLLENHPDLFWKAALYERENPLTGERYTWRSRESLRDLAQPERIQQIKAETGKNPSQRTNTGGYSLLYVLSEEDDGDQACLVCHL